MKRKTLKDIKVKKGINNSTIRKDIKAEAIKWVKEDIKEFDIYLKENRDTADFLNKRWMKRLNITEEDLE